MNYQKHLHIVVSGLPKRVKRFDILIDQKCNMIRDFRKQHSRLLVINSQALAHKHFCASTIKKNYNKIVYLK